MAAQSNGATYCGCPTDNRCDIVIAFTPTGQPAFTYHSPHKVDKELGPFDTIWTFDQICVRLARRESCKPDPKRDERKNVVGAGWVQHCLAQGIAILGGRFDKWEIM